VRPPRIMRMIETVGAILCKKEPMFVIVVSKPMAIVLILAGNIYIPAFGSPYFLIFRRLIREIRYSYTDPTLLAGSTIHNQTTYKTSPCFMVS